jgi:hypothetical protein
MLSLQFFILFFEASICLKKVNKSQEIKYFSAQYLQQDDFLSTFVTETISIFKIMILNDIL